MEFRRNKKTIAMVLYPGVTALDVVGTLEALIGLNMGSPYRTLTVGKSTDPIKTDTSLTVIPNRSIIEVPNPFGLIVPGGDAALEAIEDERLRSYICSAGERADLIASIGTGSLILAAAGLLKEGQRATTHWAYAEKLEAFGVHYVRERWVEDEKLVTAAGTTAGIDMSLFLMAKLTSESAARRVQLAIEYDPQPPFGGIDWGKVEAGMDGLRAAPASGVADGALPEQSPGAKFGEQAR